MYWMMRWVSRTLVVAVMPALLACGDAGQPGAGSGNGQAEVARIEGSVFYRERMLLPPGVEVEIQLEDISRPDAMATVLASVLLTPTAGPPYDFAIEYDPADIDSRMRYALRATISDGDRLLFSSTDYIDPFKGNPVEILVQKVPEVVRQDGPALDGTVWILHTLAGEPAGPGAGGKPVDIQFRADDMVAAGFSGCNRYTGSYVREGVAEHGAPLRFGPLAGTRMACADGGDLEQVYLQALARVSAFRLEGDTLTLLAGPEVLATFKSS